MASNKETIYIDVDDEITGIIDKVRGSSGKVVALVLPKRAGVFQSIVNMKLLKRAADGAGKNLVLITSEAGLIPLAGASGIHVAKTINSKPEIPVAPSQDDPNAEEAIDDSGAEQAAAVAAGAGIAAATDKSVGELADSKDGVETVELDNSDGTDAAKTAGKKPKAAAAAAGAGAADKAKKGATDKKKKIPDFNKFRLKMLAIGGIILLLIIGLILGIVVLPHATISIKTDATNVPVQQDLVLSTTATSLDTGSDTPTVPAKVESEQKTYSQQVPTTGQKNHGNKASGTVTVTNCGSSDVTLPAGTGFSASGNTYISQQSVTVPVSDFHGQNGPCRNNGQGTVTVQAQSGGSAANLPSGSTFNISGNPGGLSAQGNNISGGTDNIVQTVNQNDITKAKSQISTANDNNEKKSLQDKLKKDGYFAVTATFSAGTPNVTQSAQVGDVASNVTVTEVVTYTMFGAHEKDLNTVVDNDVKNQVDTSKQVILDAGLDTASFAVNSSTSTSAQVTMQTNAAVGPDLNTTAIKQDSLGKKPADVKQQVGGNPDVKDVDVHLSPFWVSSVPKKASKVTVKIAKPTTTKGQTNGSTP